jgi:transcriptional regulator with XRE-family HTH domain
MDKRSHNTIKIKKPCYNPSKTIAEGSDMPFAQKLSHLRKQRGLTQMELSEKIGIGIAQMRRYEKGNSSPTLEVIKNIAKTLAISADELIFDEGEQVIKRKVQDKELLAQFEQLERLSPHDKEALKTIIESMILKSRLEQIMPSRPDAAWSKQMRTVVDQFRQGAADFSDDEIESIVDDAVDAVRKAS